MKQSPFDVNSERSKIVQDGELSPYAPTSSLWPESGCDFICDSSTLSSQFFINFLMDPFISIRRIIV
jgi:hypothetical protein